MKSEDFGRGLETGRVELMSEGSLEGLVLFIY